MMRAATLIRVSMIVMFLASFGVAGTSVVLNTTGLFSIQTEPVLTQTGPGEAVLTTEAEPSRPFEPMLEQTVQVDPLQRQLQPYQVRLTDEGQIVGRVNLVNPLTGLVGVAQDITVSFLQNGAVVSEARPDLEGKFTVPLLPGKYSVVGAGPDGYIAYAMQVMPAELTVDAGGKTPVQPVAFQEVTSELAIDSVAVPVTDLPMVLDLSRSVIPPELLAAVPSGEGVNPGPPLTPEQQEQFTDNRADVALQGHQVQIRADGRLVGRVHRISQDGQPSRIRRQNVFLVQDNQVLAQASVSELGSFEFFDVEEGVYSFVAAGMEGLAAFTMQAVSGPNLAGIPEELTLVSANNNGEMSFGATTDTKDTPFAMNQAQSTSNSAQGGRGVQSPPNVSSSGSTSSSSNGAKSGGNGSPGTSNLSSLMGAAAGVAGAALGAAAASNNSNANDNPMSPSQPGDPVGGNTNSSGGTNNGGGGSTNGGGGSSNGGGGSTNGGGGGGTNGGVGGGGTNGGGGGTGGGGSAGGSGGGGYYPGHHFPRYPSYGDHLRNCLRDLWHSR